jgi:hypothetical protein
MIGRRTAQLRPFDRIVSRRKAYTNHLAMLDGEPLCFYEILKESE